VVSRDKLHESLWAKKAGIEDKVTLVIWSYTGEAVMFGSGCRRERSMHRLAVIPHSSFFTKESRCYRAPRIA
jgi:hypothetical protein